MKKRILKYLILILLFIPTFTTAQDPVIMPPEIRETKVNFTWRDGEAQFSKKYAIKSFEQTGDAVVCDVALVLNEIYNEMTFFVMVSYIRVDQEHSHAAYIWDGYDFLLYTGSTNENRDHLFEIRMFQWFWYMRHGLRGFMYIPEYGRRVPINVPAYVFEQIDLEYEIYKER